MDNFRSIPNVKILYAVETDGSIGRGVFKERKMDPSGVLVSFEKYDQILSDKSLNAVVICTPTVTHCDLASKGRVEISKFEIQI